MRHTEAGGAPQFYAWAKWSRAETEPAGADAPTPASGSLGSGAGTSE
jgi:hypothetical protein